MTSSSAPLPTPEGPGSVSGAPSLPDGFTDTFTSQALRGSFGWSRALEETIAQDQQRKTTRLTMPVLAIGGDASFGENVGNAVQAVADDVHSVIIPGTGHFVAEESPDEVLAALMPFLTPYRDGSTAVRDTRPPAAAVR